MEYDIKKLEKIIEEKRKELHLAIENGEKEDVIYKKSTELDEAIAEHIKATEHYEECKKKLDEFKDILQMHYKDEVINMIKNEVIDKFKNSSEKELEHFCNNVYMMSCLKAHNINRDKTMELIMCNNHIFLYENKIDFSKEDSPSLRELSFYTKLEEKYTKIIKEKI